MANFEILVGTKLNDTIQKQLDKSPVKTVTVKPILDNKGLQVGTKTVTQYAGALGEVTEATKKVYTNGKDMSNSITKVKSTVDTTSKSIQTASKHTRTLGEDFISTAGKVAKFGAITAIFGLVTRAIGEAVSSVKELDASLTELQKVTDLSGDGLQNYTEQAFSMARDLKSTASDVTDAVTEFAKSNYTLEESQLLAEQALIFKTIADDAITASDSATMLIQVMKAYNMTVSESEHIVNSINEVSNKYALSSSDLSNSIGKVASSAKTAGVDFESLLGLMTAGTEVTQNASKTANGLKSILVNLMSDKLSDQFKEFGIDMRDSNGAMKDGYTILQELSDAYNNMELVADETGESLITTNDNMNKLLEDLGGKYNINTLTAILGNFDNAINATESAFNSANSASDEYAVAMDSIAKKTEGLRGAFQELVWDDGGLQGLIKGFLDASTAILKITSDLGGLPVVLMAILSVTTLLKGQMITVGLIKLANFIPTLMTSLKGLQIMYNSATKSIILSNQAINLSIPVIGLVVTAITALTMAWNAYSVSQEEATRQAKESLSAYAQQSKASADTISKINDEATSRQQLEATVKSLNSNYSDEELALKNVNDLRQDAIDLLYKEAKAKAQQAMRETSSEYSKQKEYLGKETTSFSAFGVESDYGLTGTPEEKLKASGEWIDWYNSKIDDLTENEKKQLSIMSDYYAKLKEEVDNATSVVNGYTDAQSIANMTQEQWLESTQKSTEAQEEQNNVTSEAIKSKEELAEVSKEVMAGFSDIQSAYDTLSTAMNEYNENGTYSLDTVSKLLSLDSEYLSMLQLVNGQMTVNEEAIRNKVIAQAEEAKQEIYSTAIAELNAIATGKSAEATDTLATKKSSSSIDIAKQTTSLSENNYQLAINNALQAQGQESQGAVNDVIKRTTDSINAINTAVGGMGINFEGSMGKAKSSTKKATNALKDQKDALNDLKSQYDSAIDYIVSKYDKEIDAIEKAKKVALDAVDARIKAKNREKDNELNAIDDEINALESERDAREAYWDSVINGLKKVNTERERALALQQAQEDVTSAKSKKVMIFKDKSFGYGINESEVATAEQNLSDLQEDQAYEIQIEKLEALKSAELANYESRLNSLNSYKDSVSASYDEQISNLESYRESVEANYDAQIAYYEMYKEQFIEMTEQYQVSQDGLMASQLTGIALENNHWMTRLENLSKFVSSYNSLLNRIGSSSSTDNTSVQASWKARGYANGISSVPSDQMAIIGDNPSNSELVIGGKLNGVATKLERGSRVVNSTDTRNLLGGLSSMLGYNGLNGQTIGTVSNNNTSTKGVVNNIVVNASVQDGEGLVDYLQSFANQMTQKAYAN